jgi:hypothetical protein
VVGEAEEIPRARIVGQVGGRPFEQRHGLGDLAGAPQLVAAAQGIRPVRLAAGGQHKGRQRQAAGARGNGSHMGGC